MLADHIYPLGHLILGLAELFLIGWALRLVQNSKGLAMLVLPCLLLSTCYDNILLATGRWLGTGDLLYHLSEVRFLLHFFIVPFFIVVGVELANRAGAGWVIPLTRGLAWVLAIGLGLLDYFSQYLSLELVPEQFAGVLRYTNASVSGPPWVTIISNLFLLAIAIGLWIRFEGKWPWLVVASTLGFVGNAIPISQVGTLSGSTAEFILAVGLLFTEQYVSQNMITLGLNNGEAFKIIPLEFNWVAIHPQPKGVIYFIGGAGFGSFPTIFYRYILRRLFQEGYTIIALPFRFTLNHWSVAIQMVRDQEALLKAIAKEAHALGYTNNLDLYTNPTKIRSGNYYWLGHSLGCKYITLLQLLTDLEILRNDNQNVYQVIQQHIRDPQQANNLIKALEAINLTDNLEKLSLRDQSTILMAPIITGIEGAIPVRAIANIVKKFIDARPSEQETKQLIEEGTRLIDEKNIVRATAIIGFNQDKVQDKAKTIEWLRDILAEMPAPPINQQLDGQHLAPLNILERNNELANLLIGDLPKLKALVQKG